MDALTDDGEPTYDYESIKQLAADLGQRITSLIALSAPHDPFYIRPHRQAAAKRFAELWRQYCEGRRDSRGRPSNMHVRAIHYVLVSLENPPRFGGDQLMYANTEECYIALCRSCQDARLLDLVPFDRIDDERNDVPVEHLPNYAADDTASVTVTEETAPEVDLGLPVEARVPNPFGILPTEPIKLLSILGVSTAPDLLEMPDEIAAPDLQEVDVPEIELPTFELSRPQMTPPWFHLELWCEKTTMNDILLEIAQERRLNLITGPGYKSVTACHLLIERAKRSGRPVRILYISDFDPDGEVMPVASARGIEFLIRRDKLDLDIKLIQVALTKEQCVLYELPRTPLKDSVGGKEAFEERHGEGGTELDALEALHPGELRRILLREIDRYSDPTFPDRLESDERDLNERLDKVRDEIIEPYREELGELAAKQEDLIARRMEEIESVLSEKTAELNEKVREAAQERVEAINEQIERVQEAADGIDEEIAEQFGPAIEPLKRHHQRREVEGRRAGL